MPKTRGRKKMVLMILLGVVATLAVVVVVALALAWTELGASPSGARLARMEGSPNYVHGKFQNPTPVQKWSIGQVLQWMRDYRGQKRIPDEPPPIVELSEGAFASPPTSGLRLTWLGHSTVLVEIDGHTVLTDPMFGERSSPFGFAGPRRFFPPPISVADLPNLDVVVISHDHFDHLDHDSVVALTPKTRAFFVPLGVAAHLEYWGVAAENIVELDWWEEGELDGLRLVSLPARHFSGRMGFGDGTQWAAWAIVGLEHRVFFSGDTGITPVFEQVGERFGPFDATLIKVGAYGRGWPDVHIDPEEAVRVHCMVGGKVLLPIHWGTFNLSYHAWTEPAERTLVAAVAADVAVVVPRAGQSFEPANPPQVERWWPDVE